STRVSPGGRVLCAGRSSHVNAICCAEAPPPMIPFTEMGGTLSSRNGDLFIVLVSCNPTTRVSQQPHNWRLLNLLPCDLSPLHFRWTLRSFLHDPTQSLTHHQLITSLRQLLHFIPVYPPDIQPK